MRVRSRTVRLDDVAGAESWIHVARAAEFRGHPAGAFAFDDDVFATIVRNFESQANPLPVVIGHPDEDTDAVGWIHELSARESGLWARVEWVDGFERALSAKKFRFCSGVFAFERAHRETGEDMGPCLLEVGLTNRPYIDGLEPLDRMHAHALEDMSMDRDALIKALGLPKEATDEAIKKAVEGLLMMSGAMNGDTAEDAPEDAEMAELEQPPVDAPADAEPVDDAAAMAAEAMQAVADALGVDIAEAIAAVKAAPEAVAAAITGGTGDAASQASLSDVRSAHELALSERRKREAAEAKLASYEADRAAEKREQRIMDAVEKGYLLDDQAAFARKLSDAALDDYLALAANKPAVPVKRIKRAPGQMDSVVTLSDDARPYYVGLVAAKVPHDRAVTVATRIAARVAAGEQRSAVLREEMGG